MNYLCLITPPPQL